MGLSAANEPKVQQYHKMMLDAQCVLRCRGQLRNELDVLQLFPGHKILAVQFININKKAAQAPRGGGWPLRECCVQFADRSIAASAQRVRLPRRNIDVFPINPVDLYELVQQHKLVLHNGQTETAAAPVPGHVRITGLPFKCTPSEIRQFFQGLNVGEVVFGLVPGSSWKRTGEGFVRFSTEQEAELALTQNYKHLGNRYVQVFKTDAAAFDAFRAQNTRTLAQAGSLDPENDDSLPCPKKPCRITEPEPDESEYSADPELTEMLEKSKKEQEEAAKMKEVVAADTEEQSPSQEQICDELAESLLALESVGVVKSETSNPTFPPMPMDWLVRRAMDHYNMSDYPPVAEPPIDPDEEELRFVFFDESAEDVLKVLPKAKEAEEEAN